MLLRVWQTRAEEMEGASVPWLVLGAEQGCAEALLLHRRPCAIRVRGAGQT